MNVNNNEGSDGDSDSDEDSGEDENIKSDDSRLSQFRDHYDEGADVRGNDSRHDLGSEKSSTSIGSRYRNHDDDDDDDEVEVGSDLGEYRTDGGSSRAHRSHVTFDKRRGRPSTEDSAYRLNAELPPIDQVYSDSARAPSLPALPNSLRSIMLDDSDVGNETNSRTAAAATGKFLPSNSDSVFS